MRRTKLRKSQNSALSQVMGLLCSEQHVENFNKYTLRNSGTPSAAPLCGFLCIGSEQSTCPSSPHSTCLASQECRCLGSQQATCLTWISAVSDIEEQRMRPIAPLGSYARCRFSNISICSGHNQACLWFLGSRIQAVWC